MPREPIPARPFIGFSEDDKTNISDIIRFKVNHYPVFKQCDARWANNEMGPSTLAE